MITLDTIEGFKPLNNFVLLGNPTSTEKIGGLFIDTTYKPEDHVEIINEVIAVPDHLKFNEWETEMQLKVGDKVWVNRLTILKAEKIYAGGVSGTTYLHVPYEKIILAKRGDEIIMLNGNILLEPILKDQLKSDTIILLPQFAQVEEYQDRGIVRFIGIPNKRYTEEHHSDDDINISIGDKVLLGRKYNSKLESSYHEEIGNYLITQRRYIIAKMED
jgi:co-chaperonin GroES (HSP10)